MQILYNAQAFKNDYLDHCACHKMRGNCVPKNGCIVVAFGLSISMKLIALVKTDY